MYCFSRSSEELRDEFPMNTYAVGQIALKSGRIGKEKFGDSAIGFYNKKIKKSPDASEF